MTDDDDRIQIMSKTTENGAICRTINNGNGDRVWDFSHEQTVWNGDILVSYWWNLFLLCLLLLEDCKIPIVG